MRTKQRKGWYLLGISAMLLIWGYADVAYSQSSDNYTIVRSVLDEGGGTLSSTNYTLSHSIGQPGGIGSSSSSSYTLSAGFYGSGFCILGDMNCDKVFDIFDLMKLINCILDQGSCAHGDLNGDGEYDIFDLMKLINKILAS